MKGPGPRFTTTVDPSEYDVHAQAEEVVRMANREKACFLPIDVGKFYGLYLAWKRLAEEKSTEDATWK
ncbi:MAG: hypothetical protein WC455_29165 [Dehalococcoidia bacterium]|jgi:hypothetical protein